MANYDRRVWEMAMLRRLAFLWVLLPGLSTGAVAQNAGDFMNMFSGMMRAAIIEHARTEWSNISPNETPCIEQGLQQHGYSIDSLVQQGIAPQDPRVSGIRSGCRIPNASLPSPNESGNNISDISAKPTFDCSKARSATARIVCLDQDGAKADWDLISAYWARNFSIAETDRAGFDQAQQNWLEALPNACGISGRPNTIFPAERQCVLTAYRNRAAGYRSQLRGDALAESKLSPEQHARIQQALVTLGFLQGDVDGEFGPTTRSAINQLQTQHGDAESVFLNAGQREQLLRTGPAPKVASAPSGELSRIASKLSADEAASRCHSSDAETRLIGCTAVIDKSRNGFASTITLADALDGRCWAYNDLGEYERGLPDCNTSVSINPRRYFAYNTLGNSLLGLGDTGKALAAFTKSVELKPGFSYSHLGRARASVASGNTEMARTEFNYVLTIDPTNQVAKDGIADLDNPPAGGPAIPPKPVPAPPQDTPKLKEARVFLDDAQKFIAGQQTVPSISAIAKEAANLKIAVSNFDEAGAVQSMGHLSDLLKPITGFEDFEKQQRADRQREDARKLAEANSDGDKNLYFIDKYLKDNLGDPKTAPLIKLREQIDVTQKKAAIEQITKANDALQAYVTSNDLSTAYQRIVGEYANPTTPKPENPATLDERLGITDTTRFVVEGPADEIPLLYNASPTAPSVWMNVRGDIAFQSDAATLCFGQAKPEVTMLRYTERKLEELGAKTLTSGATPCDLSRAGSSIDIIAFQRGELLKQREDYIRALVKLIEGNSFRKYQVISDYASLSKQREILSLQLESDVEKGARKGFGVIAVSDAPAVCVVNPTPAEQVDGVNELLRRNRDLIAPKLTSDWQLVQGTTDLAFRGLQRQQCGYVAGDADVLRTLVKGLRREQIKYKFAPVWFEVKDVEQATFDVSDVKEQGIRKDAAKVHAQQADDALAAIRLANKQSEKSEIERGLRQKNGVRARALTNGVHDFIRGLAEKRLYDNDHIFRDYSSWLNGRFEDQWETFNVNSDVADFGTVQWNGRPLDAIIVRSVVQQKNRILGKYEDHCYLFGLVDDREFTMQRDLFAVDCDSGVGTVSKWKVGEHFQSQWNAN
jgi:tetratricopeptide (TPR) repeat protein